MSQSLFDIDRKLKTWGPLRRYSSLSAAGLDAGMFPVTPDNLAQVERWRKKITHTLESSVRVKTEVRAAEGWRVDPDEALDGESECFRLHLPQRKGPVRIGINLSAAYLARDMNALRGGAIISVVDLLKKQGRRFSIEVAYGNGLEIHGNVCHVRVGLEPFSELVGRLCLSRQSMLEVGERLVKPLAPQRFWKGYYRFHEFEAKGLKEFDFVLDRIETPDIEAEERRIMARLIQLGVSK